MKNIEYWKSNCEEDYLHTPISVLRYITELEKDNQTVNLLKEKFHRSVFHGCVYFMILVGIVISLFS